MNSEAKPIKPKRRWLRFSLRSFLIFVTIFTVWLNSYVRVRRQREAATWIADNGGRAWYDCQFDCPFARNTIGNNLPQPDVSPWLFLVFGRDSFSSVVKVDLRHSQIDDITPLKSLSDLKKLECSNTQLIDLKPIAKLTELEYLGLINTQVSDLKPLANLTKLKVLWLGDMQVGVEQIEKLQQALPNCDIRHW